MRHGDHNPGRQGRKVKLVGLSYRLHTKQRKATHLLTFEKVGKKARARDPKFLSRFPCYAYRQYKHSGPREGRKSLARCSPG